MSSGSTSVFSHTSRMRDVTGTDAPFFLFSCAVLLVSVTRLHMSEKPVQTPRSTKRNHSRTEVERSGEAEGTGTTRAMRVTTHPTSHPTQRPSSHTTGTCDTHTHKSTTEKAHSKITSKSNTTKMERNETLKKTRPCWRAFCGHSAAASSLV